MINLPFSETKENKPSYHRKDGKSSSRVNTANILGTSYRHHNVSNTHRRTMNDVLSANVSNQNLPRQISHNHDNGVHIEPRDVVGDSLKRGAASMIEHTPSDNTKALQKRHTALPTAGITSSPIKNITDHNDKPNVVVSNVSRQRVILTSIQKRYILLCCTILLVFLRIFVDINGLTDYSSPVGTVTTSKDWIMSYMPSVGMTSYQDVETMTFSGSAYNGDTPRDLVGPNAISMHEEWIRVKEMSKERARQRRMRIDSAKETKVPDASSFFSKMESSAPPSLVLDLPSHRPLINELPIGASQGSHNNHHLRRLEQLTTNVNVCGQHAQEASQLLPNRYPEHTALNSNSRVVVTGALSQLGMEVILSLHEQCGVSYIMGIDSAYPNTRHERIEMMEWRYKYIAKRVPGFQKLMIPVFGVHPHPNVGEEIKYESEGNSFTIMRFRPTHVVHLAGMEEGMEEHTDYGDNTDASPFSNESSDMMRRFESLVSMDQVLMALKNAGTRKPQLVYVSSNEAGDHSGVDMVHNAQNFSSGASLYGTISLVKEIMASYYYHHHSVNSVGLRVPTLLGPFARPGSVLHDLAERTVRNAAGKNINGVPKYHTDRDRYELSTIWKKRKGANDGRDEQIAFASDVAQAVIAALQFCGDGVDRANGPTIMRLGSKGTTSMKDMLQSMEGYLPSYNQWETSEQAILSSRLPVTTAYSRGLSIYDDNRNRDLLGWTHSTNLHEGTKAMLAWHVLKAYPFGLPNTIPSHEVFQQIVADSFSPHDRHSLVSLPCASGCRWSGFCTSSGWDEIIEVSKSLTQSCQYVLYTVDLRPELVKMEKQSSPSQRPGWEDRFCKIAFVSSSSKLAKSMYGSVMNDDTPQQEWNGKRKDGYWFVVAINGSQYTMNESARSMLKLAPNNMFNDRVEKAMYINHRRVSLTTDQATGVMKHLEMNGRDHTDKKTIITEDKTEVRVKLPPRAQRRSVFFTNRYMFPENFDTSNAKNLAKFVMTNMGIVETSDIRAQIDFYQQTGHFTRTNTGRSTNYQEFFQQNLFPYDFLRTSWLVHELKSHEGRNLRCEIYQEHSIWGNNGMEDLSIGYVLASRKVRMQLGKMAAPEYEGPEEWYPLLEPKEPGDEDAITEGPVYLDYLDENQKTTKDDAGVELYITFLPQKRE